MTEEKEKKPKEEKSPRQEDKSAKGGLASGEKKVKIPEKFKGLVEQIEKLNVLDLAELVKVLEDKFGVSATSFVSAASAAGATAQDGEKTEEKSSFDIELKGVGDQKISVIKVVKEITGQGLKEAKDLVDSAPKVIKQGLKREEAEELKKKLEEAGATVELK